MPLARTTILIDKTILDRFFRAYPTGKRSLVIRRLIERDLDQQAARLTRAAELVETHRDFESVRDDGSFWERATTTVSNR